MKIVFIAAANLPIPSAKGGATETLVTNLIEQNEIEKKHDFIIFSPFDSDAIQFSKKYKKSNFFFFQPIFIKRWFYNIRFNITRVLRKLTKGYFMQKYGLIDYVCKTLKKIDYDLVIVEGNPMYIRQIYKKLKTKVYFHIHTDVFNYSGPIDKKKIMSCISGFISVSISEANNIKTAANEVPPIYVLKNAIDINKFNRMNFSDDLITAKRKELCLNDDDFVLVYCGRVVEEKGVLEIVQALKCISNKIKLIIIGSSWFGENNITNYIEKISHESESIKNRIVFTGYIKNDELPIYYCLSDLSIFPSRYNETAGLVVLESLACGTPAITPDFGGMREFAPETSCYFIDTRKDCKNHIIEIINHILVHNEEYLSKKEKARESIELNSCENYYKNFDSILEDLSK